jgi:hypothetical protein
MNEQTLLQLILLYISSNFRPEYRIKDFVFTNHYIQILHSHSTKLTLRTTSFHLVY